MEDKRIEFFHCNLIRTTLKLTDIVIDNTKNKIGSNINDNSKIALKNISDYFIEEIDSTQYLLTNKLYHDEYFEKYDQYKDIVMKFCVQSFLNANHLECKDVTINYDLEESSFCIKRLSGVDMMFDDDKIILNLEPKFEFTNPKILLFNEKESIISRLDVDKNFISFSSSLCIHFKKYKIIILDDMNIYEVVILDPNILSVEPFILIKNSIVKLSYNSNSIFLSKARLKSMVSIDHLDHVNERIFLYANTNKSQVPNTCKFIFMGRSNKQMIEVDSEIMEQGIIKCEIPLQNLVGQPYTDIYLQLLFDDYERICHLSGKESYFEQTFKINGNEIAIATTKSGTIEIQVLKEKSWITKKKNIIRYKFIRLLEDKLHVDGKHAIFESYGGRQYSCHPRAMYEYIKNTYPEIKCIWSVEPGFEKIFKEKKLSYVRRFSLKWFYYMVKSKYWISNTRFPLWVKKPNDTIYVQTWHGTPLKRLGTDINEIYMPNTDTFSYNRNFYRESRNWDYLVSPNRFSTNIFSRAFSINHDKIIESGSPRNDFLVRNADNGNLINQIKQEYNIPLDKKVILYAPTWRDDQFFEKGKYKFNTALDLDRLQAELSDEYVLILRMHYLVADSIDLKGYENFTFNISYGDITQLYLISDVLVTDYSSVYFDYSVLKRPMVFFMYDIDDYRDRLRGFYLDVETSMPGPIVETNEDLITHIKGCTNDNKELQNFLNIFCKLEDGNATKRVCDIVFNQYDER